MKSMRSGVDRVGLVSRVDILWNLIHLFNVINGISNLEYTFSESLFSLL